MTTTVVTESSAPTIPETASEGAEVQEAVAESVAEAAVEIAQIEAERDVAIAEVHAETEQARIEAEAETRQAEQEAAVEVAEVVAETQGDAEWRMNMEARQAKLEADVSSILASLTPPASSPQTNPQSASEADPQEVATPPEEPKRRKSPVKFI